MLHSPGGGFGRQHPLGEGFLEDTVSRNTLCFCLVFPFPVLILDTCLQLPSFVMRVREEGSEMMVAKSERSGEGGWGEGHGSFGVQGGC